MSKKYKGIILSGGSGARPHSIIMGCSKLLLSSYDKPMFYCPLSVLMLSDAKGVLVISTPNALSGFQRLLGYGSQFDINICHQ
jgi:glucose-1-phosphate thymidylyltransferase